MEYIQGSQCAISEVDFITERGGVILWFNAHLHTSLMKSKVLKVFQSTLDTLSYDDNGESRAVAISIDAGSLTSSATGFACSNNSPDGFTVQEILEIAMICGRNSNVFSFYFIFFLNGVFAYIYIY
jgi:hypothetical protein